MAQGSTCAFARSASAPAVLKKLPEHRTLLSTPLNLRSAVLLPLGAAMLFASAGCKRQHQPAPDVWAQVNGQDIKRDDVDKYYRTRVSPEGQEPSQEEALSLKLNVLDELINNEILLERAKKLNLE